MTQSPFEAAHNRIDRQVAEAQERAAAATEYRQTVERLRGTASSQGVTVSVDASGALVSLDLPHDLTYKTGPKLANTILQTVRAAYADVSSKVREQAAASFGEGSPAAQRMDEEIAKRTQVIGEPEEPERERRRW